MNKCLIRWLSGVIILIGIFLFFRFVHDAFSSALVTKYSDQPHSDINSSPYLLFSLGLGLPVPFHVVSIGLFLQRQWFPSLWARVVWFAIAISGCWLGIALVTKLFLEI